MNIKFHVEKEWEITRMCEIDVGWLAIFLQDSSKPDLPEVEVACPLLVESIPEISSPDCPKITTRIRTCVHFGGDFESVHVQNFNSNSPPKCTHVRILVVILGQSGLEISGIDSTRRGHATSIVTLQCC